MSINIVQSLLYSLIFICRDEKLQNISNFNESFVCVWFEERQILHINVSTDEMDRKFYQNKVPKETGQHVKRDLVLCMLHNF